MKVMLEIVEIDCKDIVTSSGCPEDHCPTDTSKDCDSFCEME